MAIRWENLTPAEKQHFQKRIKDWETKKQIFRNKCKEEMNMTKKKILKLKVGEIFKDGKAEPVFKTFFPRESKAGNKYYSSTDVIFIQEIEDKPKEGTTSDL